MPGTTCQNQAMNKTDKVSAFSMVSVPLVETENRPINKVILGHSKCFVRKSKRIKQGEMLRSDWDTRKPL